MNTQVKSDLFRTVGKSSKIDLIIRILKDPCFRFMYFWRMSKLYYKFNPLGFVYHLFYRRYTFKYGIQIPKEVNIGYGFLLLHQGGIVINANAKIGNNCTVLHNVTIGNTKRGKYEGTPTIGDNVYIGPGAVIVGNITISNNVLIAPNCYVNCNVPENSVVIGNPCKIYAKEDAVSGYINNPYPI